MSSDKGNNPKQPGGRKKGKNNKKKQENSTPEKSSENPTGPKKTPHFPCFICNKEHYTRDCPHRAEVAKFLKASGTSAVLTDPFPNLETNLVAIDHASTSQVLMLSISKKKNDALISTRNKDYGNPSSSNNRLQINLVV